MPADFWNMGERIACVETKINTDRMWFGIIVALSLGAFGITNFFAIPYVARNHLEDKVPTAITQAVDEWLRNKGLGSLTTSELEDRANRAQKMTADAEDLIERLREGKRLLEEDWQDARDLASGWENIGGDLAPLGYAVDAFGIVYLRGAIEEGKYISDEPVFFLPEDYRPKYKTQVAVACKGMHPCSAVIWKNGKVSLERAKGNLPDDHWTSFDGVSFPSAGSAN